MFHNDYIPNCTRVQRNERKLSICHFQLIDFCSNVMQYGVLVLFHFIKDKLSKNQWLDGISNFLHFQHVWILWVFFNLVLRAAFNIIIAFSMVFFLCFLFSFWIIFCSVSKSLYYPLHSVERIGIDEHFRQAPAPFKDNIKLQILIVPKT